MKMFIYVMFSIKKNLSVKFGRTCTVRVFSLHINIITFGFWNLPCRDGSILFGIIGCPGG